jgi:hypothetical protein
MKDNNMRFCHLEEISMKFKFIIKACEKASWLDTQYLHAQFIIKSYNS